MLLTNSLLAIAAGVRELTIWLMVIETLVTETRVTATESTKIVHTTKKPARSRPRMRNLNLASIPNPPTAHDAFILGTDIYDPVSQNLYELSRFAANFGQCAVAPITQRWLHHKICHRVISGQTLSSSEMRPAEAVSRRMGHQNGFSQFYPFRLKHCFRLIRKDIPLPS